MNLTDDGQPGFARPSASLDVSASRAAATSLASRAAVTGIILALAAWSCDQKESRITNARLQNSPEAPVVAATLEVDSVELDPTNHRDAGPRDWVTCAGGMLTWGQTMVRACRDTPRAWVDPSRDEVAVVITAKHAAKARARVADKVVEAKFVQGRARLVVPLAAAYAKVSATKVSNETPLEIGLEVEYDGNVAKGRLDLVTPRVMQRLEHGGLKSEGDVRGTAFIGPEPDRLPPNDDRPIASFQRVVVDVGTPHLALPCPTSDDAPAAIRVNRHVRPIHLKVFESGHLLSEHRLGDDTCDAAPIGPDDITRALAGPPLAVEPSYTDMPAGKDLNEILRLARHLGIGTPSTLVVNEGPVGAILDGRLLVEVRVSGRAGVDTLKTKNLENPLFLLIDRPTDDALGALGRPAVTGHGFFTWTVDQGALTTYLELRCGPAGRATRRDDLCHTLRVGVLEGADPHDGGDVPGATPHPHDHRHPNDHEHSEPNETP